MSDEHAELCIVAVGDKFPPAKLTNLDGNKSELVKLHGEKFTVILLWQKNLALAREQYQRLQADVLDSYSQHGIQAVAIHIGGRAEEIRKLAEAAGSEVQNLVDTNEELWKQVGTERLPRVYLLDEEGKILWFDIEYSVGTRRELDNAIRYFAEDAD